MKEEKKVKFGEFETVFNGKIFTVKRRSVIYPDGQQSVHEYCQRFDSVTVLAFNQEGKLLLTREFRESKNRYVWFLPTGKIDPGESPIQAAIREMREEIGQRPNELRLLTVRPAGSSYFIWDTHIFVARNLVDDPLEQEEYFPIEVVPMELEKAAQMALSGEIENIFLGYNIMRFNYMLKNGEFKW